MPLTFGSQRTTFGNQWGEGKGVVGTSIETSGPLTVNTDNQGVSTVTLKTDPTTMSTANNTLALAPSQASAIAQATTTNAAQETAITNLTARMTSAETANATEDSRLTAVETVNNTQNIRLDGIDVLNTTQNTRLTNVENVNATQDGRLNGIDGLNTTQNTRLTNVENTNGAQDARLNGIDTLNATQDGRLGAVETGKQPLHANLTSLSANPPAFTTTPQVNGTNVATVNDVSASTFSTFKNNVYINSDDGQNRFQFVSGGDSWMYSPGAIVLRSSAAVTRIDANGFLEAGSTTLGLKYYLGFVPMPATLNQMGSIAYPAGVDQTNIVSLSGVVQNTYIPTTYPNGETQDGNFAWRLWADSGAVHFDTSGANVASNWIKILMVVHSAPSGAYTAGWQ